MMKRAASAGLFSLLALLSLAATQHKANAATCSFEVFSHSPNGTCSLEAEVKFQTGSALVNVVFHCDDLGVLALTKTVVLSASGPGDIFVPADGAVVEWFNLPAGSYNAYAVANLIIVGGGHASASTGDNYFTVTP